MFVQFHELIIKHLSQQIQLFLVTFMGMSPSTFNMFYNKKKKKIKCLYSAECYQKLYKFNISVKKKLYLYYWVIGGDTTKCH